MPPLSFYLSGIALLLSLVAAQDQKIVTGAAECVYPQTSKKPRACRPGFEAKLDDGTGCWKCEKISSDISCPDGYPDEDAPDGWRCCEDGKHTSWDDKSNTASCCDPDHSHTYDPETKTGACCPDGWTWTGSKCEDPSKPPPCLCGPGYEPGPNGGCVSVTPPPCPPGEQRTDDGKTCEPISKPPPPIPTSTPPNVTCAVGTKPNADRTGCVPIESICATCHQKPMCPGSKDLGIEFGKCYVLHYTDGSQLGRSRDNNGQYERDGFYKDLPFKVCSPDLDCTKKGSVEQKESFTLQDILGHSDWKDDRKGWFGKGFGHERITSETNRVARFSGLQSCLDGEYGICLNAFDKGLSGACPSDRLAITANVNNKRICTRFVFKEINCYDNV